MELTKRSDLNLGYSCNLRCRFCYYGESLDSKNDMSTAEVKKKLSYLRCKGVENVDLTGGEVTIRRDIFEIISYAKDIGFKGITIITNGQRLADEEFTKRLKDAGLNDILLSLHANTEETYDYLTRVKGSFKKLIMAADNIKKAGIHLRTNSTLTKPNIENLRELGKLLIKIRPDVVNFIIFNPCEDASNYTKEMTPMFSELALKLHKTIDELKPYIRKINVRFIPFCFMKGYEEYVCNVYQVPYDPYEWDPIIREKIRVGNFLTHYHIIRGLFKMQFSRILVSNPKKTMQDAISKNTERYRVKTEKCNNCKYLHVCDGLSKGYYELFGDKELTSYPGKKIKEPSEFMIPY